MRSITIRLGVAEFAAAITGIGEWLDANGCEPTRYKYDHKEDAVLVTIDFPVEAAAEAFAARFSGICPQPASPNTTEPGTSAASARDRASAIS
jgi:hypothetical protein